MFKCTTSQDSRCIGKTLRILVSIGFDQSWILTDQDLCRIESNLLTAQPFDSGFCGLQDKYKSNLRAHFSRLFESSVTVNRSWSFPSLLKHQPKIHWLKWSCCNQLYLKVVDLSLQVVSYSHERTFTCNKI